jgi:glyoxylase-like metal-dependent hydrolase (beta-lactamase superfamily II)
MPTRWSVAPDLTAEHTGGHSPGHVIIRVGGGAAFTGHLAVNPLQAAFGVTSDQHLDAHAAHVALEIELAWAMDRNALVIGPLWPGPGAGRVSSPP